MNKKNIVLAIGTLLVVVCVIFIGYKAYKLNQDLKRLTIVASQHDAILQYLFGTTTATNGINGFTRETYNSIGIINKAFSDASTTAK